MYWIRSASPLDLIVCALQFAPTWAGGWLLARHTFDLPARERLLAGLGLGCCCSSCWLTCWVSCCRSRRPSSARQSSYWLSGVGCARKTPLRSWFAREDLCAWPQLVGLALLLVLFTLINRGLSIFDDFHNLPLVSRLAVGDFPPHFYLNPDQRLAYHYGLNLPGS